MLCLPFTNFLCGCFGLQQNQQSGQLWHTIQNALAIWIELLYLYEGVFNTYDIYGLHVVPHQQGNEHHGHYVRWSLLINSKQQKNATNRKRNFGWIHPNFHKHRWNSVSKPRLQWGRIIKWKHKFPGLHYVGLILSFLRICLWMVCTSQISPQSQFNDVHVKNSLMDDNWSFHNFSQ